jgi:hypothetical protein
MRIEREELEAIAPRLSSLLGARDSLHLRMSVEAAVDWRDRQVFGRGGGLGGAPRRR